MTDQVKNISRVAKLVEDRICELRGVKSQRDIADIVGYKNQNMITMIKLGDAKLALDRVPLMAKALDVDATYLFRLAMEQFYTPEVTNDLLGIIGGSVSQNEAAILAVIRETSQNSDPVPTAALKVKIRDLFMK